MDKCNCFRCSVLPSKPKLMGGYQPCTKVTKSDVGLEPVLNNDEWFSGFRWGALSMILAGLIFEVSMWL